MKISQRGIELVKEFEGLYLTAYRCPAGVWTIGYGHTGGGVQPGDVITAERAEELLREDMATSERAVIKYDRIYHWNQNQFDALTSFAFNVGSIDQLTAHGTRSIATIADKLLLYNKAAGKVMNGLVRRREAERALFIQPVEQQQSATTDWIKEADGRWWYRNADGSYPADCWQLISGRWYHFDPAGWMQTGHVTVGGEEFWLCDRPGHDEGACMITDGRGALRVWEIE